MKKLLHRDLLGIAASLTISSFGSNLISVFVPLLLLRKGLVLWQVCAFYVTYAVAKLCINYPVIRSINRFGPRFGLCMGYGAMAAYMLALTTYLAGWAHWAVFCLPFLLAADNAFSWSSQHLHISRVMDTARTSRDMALINSLGRFVDIFAPLIGGVVAIAWGQAWLSGIATVIVLAAIIPIWRSNNIGGGYVPVKHISYDLKHAPIGDIIGNFAYCTHAGVGWLVWPVYLAVALPNFHSIGLVTTISGAVAFMLLFTAGKRGDKGKNRQVLRESTAMASLAHLSRLVATTPLGITFATAFYDTALSYQQIPWMSLYYHHSREEGISYIMSMEIACDLAYVCLWSVLGVVAYLTRTNIFFNVAFISASAIAWLCLLVRQDNRPAKENPPSVSAGAIPE